MSLKSFRGSVNRTTFALDRMIARAGDATEKMTNAQRRFASSLERINPLVAGYLDIAERWIRTINNRDTDVFTRQRGEETLTDIQGFISKLGGAEFQNFDINQFRQMIEDEDSGAAPSGAPPRKSGSVSPAASSSAAAGIASILRSVPSPLPPAQTEQLRKVEEKSSETAKTTKDTLAKTETVEKRTVLIQKDTSDLAKKLDELLRLEREIRDILKALTYRPQAPTVNTPATTYQSNPAPGSNKR